MPFQPGQSGNPKGRPPKAQKYASEIAESEAEVVSKLPKIRQALLKLALGGWKQVDEKWQPAALVTVGSGEFELPAFPDKAPNELVLVERKVGVAAPDRAALQYLIDRILGKPGAKVEIGDPDDDGTIRILVEYMDEDD